MKIIYTKKSILSIVILLFAAQAQAQFGAATLIDTSGPQFTLTVKVQKADINGDGIQDIVRITSSNQSVGNSISYYLNNGSGSFSAAQPVPGSFSYISDVAIADYNSDGRPDLLVLDKRDISMYFYPNTGGTFSNRSVITSSKLTKEAATIVLSSDFTGDGHPDLLVMDDVDVLLFAGLGNGSFDSARSLIPPAMQTELYHLVTGNFNGDAFLDFAVSTAGFMTFLNDGTGHFTLASNTAGTICFLLAPGDLNGDGVDDMLMKDHITHIMMNNGSGTFAETDLLKPSNLSYRAFTIADMDGDGKKDVYSVYDQTSRAVWFKNNGSGVLDSQVVIHQETSGGLYSCAIADMNGDGKPDPVWANVNGRIGIHLSIKTPSGLASSKVLDDVRIYPNPANTQIWIETPVSAQLIIRDAFGRTIGTAVLKAGRNPILLPYPDGMYFIQIGTADDIRIVRLVKG